MSDDTVAEPNDAQGCEDLRVWNDAVALAVEIYAVTRGFPDDERFGLTSQLRRAGTSVAFHIAEGWGRGARVDYARFLRIARGSLYEVRTQLEIARRVGTLSGDDAHLLGTHLPSVRKQLHALIRHVGAG